MFTLIPLIAGLLFGMGMVISQMIDPAKVLAFLDVTGDWDPSLALVMAGALIVFLPGYHFFIKPRTVARTGEKLSIPVGKKIDKSLVGGAAIFGVGWGVAGICPGPAVTAIGSGQPGIIVFIISMLLGQWIVAKMLKGKPGY